jgi:hypothetical protein
MTYLLDDTADRADFFNFYAVVMHVQLSSKFSCQYCLCFFSRKIIQKSVLCLYKIVM